MTRREASGHGTGHIVHSPRLDPEAPEAPAGTIHGALYNNIDSGLITSDPALRSKAPEAPDGTTYCTLHRNAFVI